MTGRWRPDPRRGGDEPVSDDPLNDALEVVELEIPARPEFVGVVRMAVAALAALRPGLPYERVDDLRIVVSEACTCAIDAPGAPEHVRVVCVDDPDRLEVRIGGADGTFEAAFGANPGDRAGTAEDDFRISLIRALVDEAEVRRTLSGSELRLVMKRDQTMGQG